MLVFGGSSATSVPQNRAFVFDTEVARHLHTLFDILMCVVCDRDVSTMTSCGAPC